MRTVVLGLGNDLLGDDGVGLLAARKLRPILKGEADVVESSEAGLALLDHLVGYDRAVIIDAVQTGHYAAGTVVEFSVDDLRAIVAPSPHYAGIPELIALAGQLQLHFPRDIRILAVEVSQVDQIGGAISPDVRRSVDEVVRKARAHVAPQSEEVPYA